MLPTYYRCNYQVPVSLLVSRLPPFLSFFLLSTNSSLFFFVLSTPPPTPPLPFSSRPSAGYGFVDFDSPAAAQKAVSSLKATGVQAQMAKVRSV